MRSRLIGLVLILVVHSPAEVLGSARGQARALAECHRCHDQSPANEPPAALTIVQRDDHGYSLPGVRDRYIVRVTGGPERAGGFALWADTGLLEPDPASPNGVQDMQERFQGEQLPELTHSRRGDANAQGAVEWWVFWTPPDDGTTEAQLVASAVAANGNGGSSGDESLHVERSVTLGCPDQDGDGHELDSCGGGDCDDTRIAINPDAVETCNGRNDDCDDDVDEGFVLEACRLQNGVCQGSAEICNDAGVQACTDALYGEDFERNEVSCDGLDNDCDGTLDELLAPPGGVCPAAGVCAQATARCIGAAGWTCDLPATHEAAETRCDSLDNDCDGQTDEGCDCGAGATRPCGSDEGRCVAGVQACEGGRWGACAGEVRGEPEACDGLDNDCDGQVDDGLAGLDCELRFGVCGGSMRRCGGLEGWLACDAGDYGQAYEVEESRCDTVDNDCDGEVDEGCEGGGEGGEGGSGECVAGESKPCGGTSVGACELKIKVCDDAGGWGACEGGVAPVPEVCGDDGDNDCDGEVDEDSASDPCAAATPPDEPGSGEEGGEGEGPGVEPDEEDEGDERADVPAAEDGGGFCATGLTSRPLPVPVSALLRR